jgi:PAS domain S-box-containing protein
MIGEYQAVELLKNGASDYVMKSQLDKLPFAVNRALKEVGEQKARKVAEKELRKLSQAVHQSPVSILITDETGIVEYVNPKTTELTQFTSDDLIGNKSWFYISDEKSKEEYHGLWQTISSGNEWRGEFHHTKKNGEHYWESASITPIFDEDGKIINYLAFREDITERKEFLIELVKAKIKAESGDRLKTAFMNNISHEIRTPLNHILGFGKLLIEPGITQEEKNEFYAVVNSACNRLVNTVTDYMDISLLVSGNMEVSKKRFTPADILNDIFVKLRQNGKSKNLNILLEISPIDVLSQINSDQELLRKVLSQLLDNAIKFTKQGTVSFGFTLNETEIEFFVRDTGPGMGENAAKYIFDRFIQENVSNTRGYEGSGIGLSISKGMVELLGGRIWFETVKGEGTAFFFTIPLQ